ncbi:FadR/GntR family transcriptional regulator [Sinorhizobium meliloti]|uniref:FadR/GntR family transcriptional regulator n=2 Tax=Rhizobium meliloti TaxID=382 RepID=UPI000405EF0C|nr:FadR/GntR family transcriptional regulator [Sinorhizobium meliloti]MDE3831124.1 FadR family transcriptional regulator [Sinorhizobium meliloti]MDE4579997.1 FadR family transcriptional regulator [Sinorhizobium meliloti]MDW9375037.1 FCD domain-containing protein [Sinorhizobium meliloti]MDW9486474.1 FCD domain-containing protein [Sinorhizobium meliloti]MDW9493646.1 FCD domain-containing protein [Sinorhizobium meliloti]
MAAMDFGQISRSEHLPARIAAKIGREITEGRIAPGEKLPTEHLLATTFGVSRSVVREAIAQLRNEGLVETRQGVGAFATEIERRQSLRIEQGDLANRGSFRDLFQLRIPLEVEAARLAAIHHTPQDLGKIDEALQQMTGAEKWTEQGIVADLAFHRAIAAATHNEYFLLFIGFIAERISLAINAARAAAVLEEIVEVTIAEHVSIRNGVAARDPVKAEEAMRHHLNGAAARLDLTIESFSS